MVGDWEALMAALVVGGGVGALIYHVRLMWRDLAFRERAASVVREAEASREQLIHAAELEAKEALLRQQEEHDELMRSQREHFANLDTGVRARETELDEIRRDLDGREQSLRDREGGVSASEKKVNGALEQAREALSGVHTELERIGLLTQQEARDELIETIRAEAERKAVGEVRRVQERIRKEAEVEAQVVLASAAAQIGS